MTVPESGDRPDLVSLETARRVTLAGPRECKKKDKRGGGWGWSPSARAVLFSASSFMRYFGRSANVFVFI